MRLTPLVVLLFFPTSAMAATITVDRYGGGDYESIQEAIDAASKGDTIKVASATYSETIDFGGKTITITGDDATITSSGDDPTVNFDSREASTAVLEGFTIEHTDGGAALNIDSANPTLKDLTISAGGTSGGGSAVTIAYSRSTFERVDFSTLLGTNGAVVVNQTSNVTFDECSWTDNRTSGSGGALLVNDSTVTITDGTFDSNRTATEGGAVWVTEGKLELTDTSFIGNSTSSSHGTAIYAKGSSTLTITNGEFISNSSSAWYYAAWGAIFLTDDSALSLDGTSFTGNSGYYGSAIGGYDGYDLRIKNATIAGNSGYHGTITGYSGSGTIDITDSTIEGNIAYYGGGAVYAYDGASVTLEGVTVSKNSSSYGSGAGIWVGTDSGVEIKDSTFEKNVAAYYGGAVYGYLVPEGVTIASSTFSGNVGGYYGGAIYLYSASKLTAKTTTFDSDNAGYYGGSLYVLYADLSLDTVSVTNAKATNGNGGGIYFQGDSAGDTFRMLDSEVSNNYALTQGGGAWIYGASSVVIDGSEFIGNTVSSTGQGGGVLFYYDQNRSVRNSRFCGNEAGSGGAVYSYYTYGSTDAWSNVVLSENTATYGGALWFTYEYNTTLTNLTFAGNAASGGGGGLWAATSTPRIKNSAFVGNGDYAIEASDSATAAMTLSYDGWYGSTPTDLGGFLSSTTLGSTHVTGDPQFVDWSADGDCLDDLHPRAGSPLIDAGDPSIKDPDKSRSDIGAFGGPSAENTDLDGDGFFGGVNDCNDADGTIYPGATEVPYDGVDQNCDGVDLDDLDGDGYGLVSDCDDTNPEAYVGAIERWYDGLDQDCLGGSDYDADGDGFDSASYGGDDCDDADPIRYPGSVERPCVEDQDLDDDGFDGVAFGGDDCDDASSAVNPGADEIWYDGVDQDCDGRDDDQDGDGFPVANDCDDLDAALAADCSGVEGFPTLKAGGCYCAGAGRPEAGFVGLLALIFARRRRQPRR